MGFGNTASKRRAAARKHALKEHRCPRCGRVIMGNGYYTHRNACLSLTHPDTAGQQTHKM